VVFGVLFVSYAYFFQGGGWNANSRFDLTRALVTNGSIAIDPFVENTGDWAKHDGHFYTNKAPGFSFLSVPAYAVASGVAHALFPEREAERLVAAAYLTNLVVNALPAALLGLLLFRLLPRFGIEAAGPRAWCTLAFGLGTLAFPYSTAYYAHQPAAVLGFAAFAALLHARSSERATPWAAAAGAAAGAAVIVEPSCLVVAVVLGLSLVFDASGRRLLPWFVAAGLPFAAVQLFYNAAAFGDPFGSSYHQSNPDALVVRDGGLFGAPSLERLYQLTLSPYRGLLFTSPLLALAAWGFRPLYRIDPRTAGICGVVVLGFLAFTTSFHAWHGGWAPGPRYLVPGLPFLFLPLALGMLRARVFAVGLGAVSIGAMLAITAVTIEVPVRIENPLADFILPRLLAGEVSVNPRGFLPFETPLVWASFNLGEGLWPEQLVSVLPLLACWGLGAFAILRMTRDAGRSRLPQAERD
jgi:hypothetical protein